MSVTAEAVRQLRERTGAGMMECKKALVTTAGEPISSVAPATNSNAIITEPTTAK